MGYSFLPNLLDHRKVPLPEKNAEVVFPSNGKCFFEEQVAGTAGEEVPISIGNCPLTQPLSGAFTSTALGFPEVRVTSSSHREAKAWSR